MMTGSDKPELDEVELDALAEAELCRLRRQYRIMEKDRATYAEQARNQMRNQTYLVSMLEHEKAELVLDIKAAKSPHNTLRDEIMSAEMKELLDKRAEFIEHIQKERAQIQEIEEQIIKLAKECHELNQKVRSEHQIKEAVKRNDRQILILENRLEVATQRFNVLVSDNAKLRKEIDDMLKERERFNVHWAKLNGQLNSGKQIIGDLIEQATVSFNQRDEELNKINALKDRGMRDLKIHTSEMCEMHRTIDNEMKLQEFLGVKGQYRQMHDLNAKVMAEKLKKREEMRNKIAIFNEILALVKEFTKEEEISKITVQFLKQEEENFALFGYVNELNEELEGLQTRVVELRQAIDEARALNVLRGQKQAETLDAITRQLREHVKKAEAAQSQLNESEEVLEKMLEGIQVLFDGLHCDDSPLMELLGDKPRVSMNNVMLYLNIIEKRICEMLNKMHWVDRQSKLEVLRIDEEKKQKLVVPTISAIGPVVPCPLCAEKEEMQNVKEGLEIALTKKEVKARLLKRLEHDHEQLLHSVSACHLPAARKIIQRRLQ